MIRDLQRAHRVLSGHARTLAQARHSTSGQDTRSGGFGARFILLDVLLLTSCSVQTSSASPASRPPVEGAEGAPVAPVTSVYVSSLSAAPTSQPGVTRTPEPPTTAPPAVTPTRTPYPTPTPTPPPLPETCLRGAFPEEIHACRMAPTYNITLTVDPGAARVVGSQIVTYTNNASEPLTSIALRLLPNAPGYGGVMTVTDLLLAEQSVVPELEVDQTALYVPLEPPLVPGRTVNMGMHFVVDVPTDLRSGHGLFSYVRGVVVNSYFYARHAAGGGRALEVAVNALEAFSDFFGPYPYTELDVVETPNYLGRMEYSGLVVVEDRLYPGVSTLEWLTAHEVAHQWWMVVVGNDQLNEPWLDEALTQYSTMLYYESVYGKDRANAILNTVFVQTYRALERGGKDMPAGLPADAYPSPLYFDTVYDKGALYFHELRERVGDELFFETLRAYYERHRFQIATPESFLDIVEDVTGDRHIDLYKEWIGGTGEES